MNNNILDAVLREKRRIDSAKTLSDLLPVLYSLEVPEEWQNILIYDCRNCMRWHYPYESGENYNKFIRLLVRAEKKVIPTPETIIINTNDYPDVDLVNAVQNPFMGRFPIPYNPDDIVQIYRGVGPEEKKIAEKGEISKIGVWWAIRPNCAIAFASKKKYANSGAILVSRIPAHNIVRYYPFNDLDNSERLLILPEDIFNFNMHLRIAYIQ